MREMGNRLTKHHIHTANARLVDDSEDLGSKFVGDRASQSIRQHAYPNGRGCNVTYPVLDKLNRWHSIVLKAEVALVALVDNLAIPIIVVVVVVVVVLLLLKVLLVVLRLQPRKANKFDRRELDSSVLQAFNSLGNADVS